MVLAPLPFLYHASTIQLDAWGCAGQATDMLHNRCHISTSPEITTESSARLMDNGDGTTPIDAVLIQSNRSMMRTPQATSPSSEPDCNQDNQPGLATPVAATGFDRSRLQMKKTVSIRQT
jgi:hypothetical protein